MFLFHSACEHSKQGETEREIKSPVVARDFHENSNKIL